MGSIISSSIIPNIEDFIYEKARTFTSSSKATTSLDKVEKKVRVSSIIKGASNYNCKQLKDDLYERASEDDHEASRRTARTCRRARTTAKPHDALPGPEHIFC